ncbi:MAG: hypothetical protein H6843_14660 [Rhodospirillaceae bacterium]|nr:hypothetical protein [Rhodospirillaceae bacterium]
MAGALVWLSAAAPAAAQLALDLGDWCDPRPDVCRAIGHAVEASNLSLGIDHAYHPQVIERRTQLMIAVGLAQLDRPDDAHRIIDAWIAQQSDHPESMLYLAEALYRAGFQADGDAAVETALGLLPGESANRQTWVLELVIDTYIATGQWQAAADFITADPDRSWHDERLEVVDGLLADGRIDDAVAVADSIPARDAFRRMPGLARVAAALADAERTDEAKALMAEVLDLLAEQEGGIMRHRFVLPIVTALAALDEWDEALAVARGETGSTRFDALILIAEAQAVAGLMGDVGPTLDGAFADAGSDDFGGDRDDFLDIQAAVARVGFGADAVEIGTSVGNRGFGDLLLEQAVRGAAAAGDWEVAHGGAAEIADASIRAVALSALGGAEAQAGLRDQARSTLADAGTAAAAVDSARTREDALREVAHAQTGAGFLDAAMETAWLIDGAGEPMDGRAAAFLSIALAGAGRWDEAMGLVDGMSRIGFGYNDVVEGLTAACIAAAVTAYEG